MLFMVLEKHEIMIAEIVEPPVTGGSRCPKPSTLNPKDVTQTLRTHRDISDIRFVPA